MWKNASMEDFKKSIWLVCKSCHALYIFICHIAALEIGLESRRWNGWFLVNHHSQLIESYLFKTILFWSQRVLDVLNYLIAEELFPSVKKFVCPCLCIKYLGLPWDKTDGFETQTSFLEHTCGTAVDLNELPSWLWKNFIQILFPQNLMEKSCRGLAWGVHTLFSVWCRALRKPAASSQCIS